jgi:hypothetical protein
MASEPKDKDKKPKKDGAAPKAEKAKGKADKAEADAEPKAAPAPRPPADPRLKVIKKLGRFLPKGPLRDRKKALMDRWNSGDDHGGVTLEELKALHADWKTSREAKKKPAKA